MKCKFCDKKCKNKISLVQHQIRCSENPDKIKTKHSEKTKKKISEKMKIVNTNATRIWKKETIEKLRISSKKGNEKYWTKENREKHSILMKSIVKKHPESYSTKNVSGRVKTYDYKGVSLKGTWEVTIAKILDKYKIKWTNKIKPIPYFWKKKWHLYFPDFYLLDYDNYIEVKGYQRERDLFKWKYVDKPLTILKKKEFKELNKDDSKIFNYIKNKV